MAPPLPSRSIHTDEHLRNAGDLRESEVWDEDRTPFRQRLVLRSDSFRPRPVFDTIPSHVWYNGILSPSQAYLYGARTKHLLDIWKLYGECLLDERFVWHKRRYKHVWGWGEESARLG
jgi:hypothetical protein